MLTLVMSLTMAAQGLTQDGEGYYLIGSLQDWKDFATLVQTTPTANAKMMADIMEVNPDNSPVTVPLVEVFHLD